MDALLGNAGIVRHRGKIESAIGNARAFLATQREAGSFAAYLWGFVDGTPVVTRRADGESLPARSALSDRISADLRTRGFGFVGPTIVYAYLQATGVAGNHSATCFAHFVTTSGDADGGRACSKQGLLF